MKKILAIFLALAMVFALVACANGDDAPPGQDTSPAANDPATPAARGPVVYVGVEPGSHIPDWSNTIGFVTDEVDHWAREEYHIVYFNFNPTGVTGQITLALEQLAPVWNFRVTQLTANNDSDTFINNLQTILIGEPDGIIVDITEELAVRTADILNQFDVPAICLFNMAMDFDGNMIIPSVVMDQFVNGQEQVRHLASVYRDFWGDIDASEIALLVIDFSVNINIHDRALGAMSAFEELFPGNRIIYGDTAADSLSSEAGFAVANALLAANPDVNYWFVVATVEDVALGSARAIEALGLNDRVLQTSSGAAILAAQWDEGYEGAWIANYSIPPFLYAGVALFGLTAMMDGRADMQTLWPHMQLPNDNAARFNLGAGMMTRENYIEYIGDFMRDFGVDPS
ncbi:MAG: hypothetical protein FWC75_00245 [Oscillospiraceae bacterium]|nr:hypothetical protein [Oscillospiraceae bacterium]